MTDAARESGARHRARAGLTHPVTLWGAFVLVHLVLGWICLTSPSAPMGDVTYIYSYWMHRGLDDGVWVGIDTSWVYPLVALVPMLLSAAFGWAAYAGTWLSIMMAVDAVAFAVLLTRGRRERATAGAAWWWLAFLLAVGPVALGRIDTVATAVSLVGVLVIVGRPALGGAVLAVAAWIKVWPAALVAGAVIALRSRLTVLASAAATTALVLLAGWILGGGASLFSFITQQSDRGLEVEAVLALPAMWAAWAHLGPSVYYDRGILAFQIQGPGTEFAAASSTPLLALATAGVAVLGVVAVRRGATASRVLPALLLAFTMSLIIFNKVGSPQYAGWIAVPIVFGLVTARLEAGIPFRTPAIFALVSGVLTQAVYPYLFDALLQLNPVLLVILTARNLLYLVLLTWAVAALVDAIRSEPEPA